MPATFRRRSRTLRRLTLVGLLALVAGCSGEGEQGPEATSAAAKGWTLTALARGVKPTLALDGAGNPAVSYVRQGVGGWVEFASAADDWKATRISEGNYAGPADLDFDERGRPHVAWHDHENAEVSARNGNLVHAVREGGAWQVATARDQGHDGFQTSIAVGGGVVHAAGIEPIQYQTDQGVEHYVLEDGAWSVASIGTGPLEYSYDVSLALGPAGPALTYFDDRAEALVYAASDGEEWTLERVASGGEAGKRSSLAIDPAGRPHVAFLQEGIVRYAVRERNGWRVEPVGAGAGGVALALGPDGLPQVAFVAGRTVWQGFRRGSVWAAEEVAVAQGRPFGARISLAVDASGKPHVVFAELLGSKRGVVVYATRS